MPERMKVADPPRGRPLMIYDGDCSFCIRWIRRWRRVTGNGVDYAPSDEAGRRFPEIPNEWFLEAVQLVEPDGLVSSGAEAALRSLAVRPAFRWPLWIYTHVPGARWLAEALYGFVARHRGACAVRKA